MEPRPPRAQLTRAEYEAALFNIQMKRQLGLKINKREERMWAYRDVGRCRCGVRRGEIWKTSEGGAL